MFQIYTYATKSATSSKHNICKPSSYKVKSVFLTFITKVWRPLLYHLTNPLYVLKTFLLYHNSQKVSRYFIYYICKEFRQVFIS